jgi:membrane protease YdiL (CAAX protease family)
MFIINNKVKECKECLVKTKAVILIAIAIAMTLLVAVENVFVPWSPYFIAYAILAIMVPILAGAYKFGSLTSILKKNYKTIVVLFFLLEIWDLGVMTVALNAALSNNGLDSNSYYSLEAAINLLAVEAARALSISQEEAMVVYIFFVIAWAPIGESLFYLGYIQGVLRRNYSFAFSALVSAGFFSVRHGMHFFFLSPYPVFAAVTWVISTLSLAFL